jgi:uncharacterized protein involved in exopolysaccharide biosynthesis
MQSLPGNVSMVQVQDNGSLRHIFEAAFRHRWLWLFIVVSVGLVSAAYTVLIPRQYKSEMDIRVQNTRADEQITPSRVAGTVMINGVTEEQINSEIQLLESRGLANVVVDPGWNNRPPGSLSADQLKAHDKAVDYFEKHLSIDLVRKSNVIHVSYFASDPKTATDALSRLLAAFLAKQREIAQPPGTAKFFADEAARYKTELDQAQQQLADYQQKNQIVSLADTEQNVDREINDAETELRNTDAQISEDADRIETQTRQLKAIPTRQATQQRIIPNDYSVERLNTMLAELQNERTSLLSKFTPEDRMVQEVDQKIADTRRALASAQKMTSQETSSDVNPVWQTVTGSIIQSETDRQALRAKRNALSQQIAGLRSSLSNTEGSTVAFTTLHQKVADLENNYQLYTQKSDEAQMADAMNENRLLNVAVQQNPTYSVTPVRPKPVVDAAIGGFTAIFLASFLVFFAEVGRDTIANEGELVRLSRLPVLATVPRERIRGSRSDGSSDFIPVFIGMTPAREPSSQRRGSPALVRLQKEGQTT